MKKLFVLIVVAIFVFPTTVFGFCLVTSGKDLEPLAKSSDKEPGTVLYKMSAYRLRYAVQTYYNEGECMTDDAYADPLDHFFGFDQALLFATSEWGGWTRTLARNRIVIGDPFLPNLPLVFDNDDENLVIGNWSEESFSDPDRDPYPAQDSVARTTDNIVDRNYGRITIDGCTHFYPGVSPFFCAPGTKEVYLRNVTILTRGISKSGLFDSNSCLRDGGGVSVQLCFRPVPLPTTGLPDRGQLTIPVEFKDGGLKSKMPPLPMKK